MQQASPLLPQEIYKQIHRHVPILCVDGIIVNQNRFLLVKRLNKPAQGQWWFPGGRVLKGEHVAEAIYRKIKEETGLDVSITKNLGYKETLFPDGPFDGPTHTVNIVFLCTVKVPEAQIQIDEQSESFEWHSQIDSGWDPYVKDLLQSVGFTESQKQL